MVVAGAEFDRTRALGSAALVAGAGYGPKQQKAPEGAECMFGMVAGAGFEPATFRL